MTNTQAYSGQFLSYKENEVLLKRNQVFVDSYQFLSKMQVFTRQDIFSSV